MISYAFTSETITVNFNAIDYLGNLIGDVGIICPSYYSHSRLIYIAGLVRAGQTKRDFP